MIIAMLKSNDVSDCHINVTNCNIETVKMLASQKAMRPSIGERIRELRQSKNLRQEQVAKIIGVDRSAVTAYENGTRQPTFDTLVSMARLFHVSTDYLLGITDARTIDITGLTENEIDILNALVQSMVQKNRMLNRK